MAPHVLGAIALGGSHFGDGGRVISVAAVNCSGVESRLWECALVVSPESCVGGAAGVICQGIIIFDSDPYKLKLMAN